MRVVTVIVSITHPLGHNLVCVFFQSWLLEQTQSAMRRLWLMFGTLLICLLRVRVHVQYLTTLLFVFSYILKVIQVGF